MPLRGTSKQQHYCVADIPVNDCVPDMGINIAQTDCVGKSNLKNNKPYIAWAKKNGGKIAFLGASEGGLTQSIWSTTVIIKVW